jgi:predicted  nucleic acid-binding Zn-ribbon protein
MTSGQAPAALRDELQQVQRELDEVRDSAATLRRQIGERSDGAADAAETSMLLTEAEQQEAVVATLEQRMARLQQRLGEASS